MLELPSPCNRADEEVARDLMVAYTAGSCSSAEKVDFESHCLSCDECLTTLAIVLRLSHFPVGEEEETTLALLYTIGMEAARVARHEVGMEVSISDGDGHVAVGRSLQFIFFGSRRGIPNEMSCKNS
jgi:hypothetical protein